MKKKFETILQNAKAAFRPQFIDPRAEKIFVREKDYENQILIMEHLASYMQCTVFMSDKSGGLFDRVQSADFVDGYKCISSEKENAFVMVDNHDDIGYITDEKGVVLKVTALVLWIGFEELGEKGKVGFIAFP